MNCNFVDTSAQLPLCMYAVWSEQLLKNKATPFRFTYFYQLLKITKYVLLWLYFFGIEYIDN